MEKISDILSQFSDIFETNKILKKLPIAHAKLAELKAVTKIIPNKEILVNAAILQEAYFSSAIEKINTTLDDLYKADIGVESQVSDATEEVQVAASALQVAYEKLNKETFLTQNTMMEIQKILVGNNAGFRKIPCTFLINEETGEVIHRPPPSQDIGDLVSELERFINDDSISDLDPIIKMALIHYQFETIHPFYDGNGRTGRIINILYLILQGLLELPVLNLSHYINKYREEYYSLLQEVRTNGDWEPWVMFFINAVHIRSLETLVTIRKIDVLMIRMEIELKDKYKFYSPELLNHLFVYPYTKIEFLVNDLGVSQITATNYLTQLADDGILEKHQLGQQNYYINTELFDLLSVQ